MQFITLIWCSLRLFSLQVGYTDDGKIVGVDVTFYVNCGSVDLGMSDVCTSYKLVKLAIYDV